MGYRRRLERALEEAPVLPISENTRYILMSDCHRGTGTTYDTFMKNRHLFLAALQYYYRRGYHYIELGDGDELWENRSLTQIRQCHEDCDMWWKCFLRQNRAHSIYGNHDIAFRAVAPEGLWLKSEDGQLLVGLVHGHQGDFWNSTLWPVSRWLVRYVWKPLERLGMNDPTQASKNYRKSGRVERRLENWAREKQIILISGHTHRARLPKEPTRSGENPFWEPARSGENPFWESTRSGENPFWESVLAGEGLRFEERKPEGEGVPLRSLKGEYLNTGSCVHPYGIMGIELNGYRASLVKWRLAVGEDGRLYVERIEV